MTRIGDFVMQFYAKVNMLAALTCKNDNQMEPPPRPTLAISNPKTELLNLKLKNAQKRNKSRKRTLSATHPKLGPFS